MYEYHKINTIFKRDMTKPNKPLIWFDWTHPEFKFLAENKWWFTEKVDGTNIRIIVDHEQQKVVFGGRTAAAQIPNKLFAKLQEIFLPIEGELLEQFEHGACLYGEGYGPGIQKVGGNYRPDQSFVLFDIRVGNWWLTRDNVEAIGHSYELDIVPVIGDGPLRIGIEMVQEGLQSRWGSFEAEGIVARPAVELNMRSGARIITKLKSRDFENIVTLGEVDDVTFERACLDYSKASFCPEFSVAA